MRHRPTLVLALLLAACGDEPTATPTPRPVAAELAAQTEPQGPPAPHPFGPDTYRVGTFTGAGTVEPGLECTTAQGVGRACTGFLASGVDGTLLDVTVLVPRGPGPFPLVTLIHGYGGSKNSSRDMAVALVDRGYAVLRYSARGFGMSWGQVNLVDVHAEVGDLRSMIGQVVDRRGLHLDPNAVAVAGASYGGGHSWLALLRPTFASPRGSTVRIRTVVPIAAWSDLLYSLVPNGRPRASVDRPGGLKLSYVNGLYGSGIRESADRPYPNYPEYFVAWHAWMNAAEPSEADPVYRGIEDGLAGYRSIWWRQDFWQTVLANRVPIFQVQGFTDDLFPLSEAKRMLLALTTLDPGYPIASYFGDLGHPRAANKPAEVEYVTSMIGAWLDFYLKGAGTAPAHVVHAAITRPAGVPFTPGDVITVSRFDELSTRTVSHAFDGSAVLVNPLSDPLGGFTWDPFVMLAAAELRPYIGPAPASAEVSSSLAAYEVPAAQLSEGAPLLIAGEPAVRLLAATASHRVQLDVRLFDVAPDGGRSLVTRGTYTLDSGSPAIPIGNVEVVIPTYGNLWSVPADHRLRIEISNVDSPYITPSRVPSITEISGVTVYVPLR